jgi:hypothetical protein
MASITVVETRPTGTIADGAAYFESSTNKFVVYDATNASWLAFASDGVGTLSFPQIFVYATEAEIFALTNVTDYTMAHAKQTDKLYVYEDGSWYIYNNDSTA